MKKKVEKMFEKEKRKEEKLKRKLEKYEGLKDSPKKRERYELNHSPLLHHIKFCNKEYLTLGAAFVRDITIPDGTTVQPGTKMQKTWRLLNTGTCIWRETTRLRLMYGTIPAIKTEVSVPCLKPGEEGDVTAELLAPELPGRYQSHWKLFDKGIAFGHRVWVMINVVPREILEPKPVEPLRVVEVKTEEEDKEVSKAAEAPEEQRVERDVETITMTTQSPMPLYRLIPSMLDQVDDAQEQELEEPKEGVVRNILQIVDTQPSPINDLNKLNSTDSGTKIESLNVDVTETDDKVEMNLSSAVAAMEKLTVSEVRTTQVANVGNNLLSFEFLDRTPPKQSQTATPSNTPLDVSPPKSPVPTAKLETVLSASSSMELVNGDLDECVPLLGEYPHERIQSLEFKQGTGYAVEDDIESLLSYSDSDSSSSDDFFVVPLPDCFDTSKPLTRSSLLQPGDVDENQNEVQSCQPSVDDLLQASTSDEARPLTPEVTALEIPRDVPNVQAVTINTLNIVEAVPSTLQIVPDTILEIPRDVSILMPVTCDEIPQSEASCVETQTTIVQNSSDGAVGSESMEAQQMDSSCYAAASGRPLTEAEHQTQVLEVANGGSQPAVECSQVNGQDASATAGGSAEQQEFAKQLFDVAITTAANAASNAYFKVKEVIHTWQAKDLERQQQTQQQQQIAQNIKVKKGWVPPKQEFKMPKNDWTPPEDTFQPPEDSYVPPQSTWTPPPDNYQPPTSENARLEQPPMEQLMSMGFCNRELNKEVLKKSNDDVSKAISLILERNQEDWSSTRH
ncbi:hypothetical protein LOTGIDRAFT_238739 [Lottia gigantea]|uniref:UBA domain-containing protein n=1 Tax=Lottia gigantea TaxID=225164 RepID=V4A6Y7_LOTGI|nr:hypothetical protein LOTGIDRAFT_238739 [Lottia gigantea]ESO99698.1 hypothetical protein LOTGIDRAFT_238739 [Lottia gigantea]